MNSGIEVIEKSEMRIMKNVSRDRGTRLDALDVTMNNEKDHPLPMAEVESSEAVFTRTSQKASKKVEQFGLAAHADFGIAGEGGMLLVVEPTAIRYMVL